MNHQSENRHVNNILLADDDADDRLLIEEALNEAKFSSQNINCVEDGEDLMDYLKRCGKYTDFINWRVPDLILLDLNMPRKDGREALKEIKSDNLLRKIPVVVLTTSTAPEDISECYDFGANTYMTKAVTFEGMVSAMKTIKQYWAEYALLS
jgi:CheY-like chemotaxis protein